MKVLEELLKCVITCVHQVEGYNFNGNLIQDIGIVDLPVCEQNEGEYGATQIFQLMHLERNLPVVKLRSCAQLQTLLDNGAIECIDYLFKTNRQIFVLIKPRGFFYQSHRKVLINTPILLLASLRKRGFGHRLDNRYEEVSAEFKCSLNTSQASLVGELSKDHHHRLVTTIELDGVLVAFMAFNTLLEPILLTRDIIYAKTVLPCLWLADGDLILDRKVSQNYSIYFKPCRWLILSGLNPIGDFSSGQKSNI